MHALPGASRTDAGAHATGQVAHLDVVGSPDSIQPDSLMMYLNGVLPPDVKVQQLQLAPEGRRAAGQTRLTAVHLKIAGACFDLRGFQ
jgi:tRNA pseudouridine(38-40) synthase